MSKLMDAIQALRPGAKCTTSGEDYFDWLDDELTQPTQEEIDAEIARQEQAYIDNEYQRIRYPNYPQLEEQFDMLWHAIDAGKLDKTSDFYTKLKKVKDDNPKSS